LRVRVSVCCARAAAALHTQHISRGREGLISPTLLDRRGGGAAWVV
jgi:hypothetical protein